MAEIKTRLGAVKGLEKERSFDFLGLPYAAPPTGKNRWMPPAPAANWDGVFDATKYPNRCLQLPFPSMIDNSDTPGELSDDCLYLNIHTPAVDEKKRPVQIYLHGGGYTAGSANDFDPTAFVVRHDVVFVAINYRLGIFGFFDVSRFGPDYEGSVSLGFQDQIAAIRWVSENIADYGGDPDNITVSGVSAGAGSVLALMGAPSAKGLFHKAIGCSPASIAPNPVNLVTPFAEAMKMSEEEFFEHLKSLSAPDLFKLQVDSGFAGGGAVDGKVVTHQIDEAIRLGVNPVPVIIGTCINEATMLMASVQEYENMPDYAALEDMHIPAIATGDSTSYVAYLDEEFADSPPDARMGRVWYDYFRSAAVRTTQTCAEVGVKSWLYSFEVPTDNPFGPTHASDMPFSFNLFEGGFAEEGEFLAFHRNTAENRQIAATWTDAIARFMRTSDPNGNDFPEWPAYNLENRPCMVLREELNTMTGIDADKVLTAYGLI